jgi:hypothetical protein
MGSKRTFLLIILGFPCLFIRLAGKNLRVPASKGNAGSRWGQLCLL